MELAVIAARVSTKDQADKGFSLPEQIAAGRDYISRSSYQLASVPGFSNVSDAQVGVFEEDFTGMSMDRPAIEAMRVAVKQHGITRIVYTEQDRLARKAIYQALLEEEFDEMGARIEFVYDRFDESDEGQFFKGVKRELAEYDRKKRLRQMRTGKIGRVKAGKLLPGYQPTYGYDYSPETGTLSICEHEAEIVRSIFVWYVYGDEENGPLAAEAIAVRLRGMHVPTRGNGATRFPNLWSGAMIHHVLENETYIGHWYYNKTKTVERVDPTTGAKKKVHNIKRPREEWAGPVIVPAIIEPELFRAARERATRNLAFSRRNRKNLYLYASLLTCEACGRQFQALDPRHAGTFYYRCNGRRHSVVKCKAPYFTERDLHEKIWPWFANLLDNPEEVVNAIRARDDVKADELAVQRERLARIENKIAELQRRIANIDDELEVERNQENKDSLRERKAQRTKERQDYERERAQLTEQLSYQAHSDEQLADIFQRCERYRHRLHTATPEQQRELLVVFAVKATLGVEDNLKIAHVSCKLGEKRVVVGKPLSRPR
jgi:site-specific DNA recombinase